MKFAKDFMLKMQKRRKKMQGSKEFKQAAFSYMGLKVLVIVLTYAFTACVGCEYSQFLRQGIHLFLFSHFIYAGMRVTSFFISSVCLIRGISHIMNYFYNTSYLLSLPLSDTKITLLKPLGAGNWVFLVNGLLMCAISIMIFRAIWARFRKPVLENGLLINS